MGARQVTSKGPVPPIADAPLLSDRQMFGDGGGRLRWSATQLGRDT